jgi:hypothetical protein
VLLERWKPATAHNRYLGLHAFYRWLGEDHLPGLMAKMKPPAVPDQPVPVLTVPQLHATGSPTWARYGSASVGR